MSAPTDNGGPAFPVLQQEDRNGNVLQWSDQGMSLRDYFAASALKSMRIEHSDNPLYADGVAKSVYTLADAMLKARQS